MKPIEDIKYLIQNNQNIFNVTPPNKKDDKKQALLAAQRQKETQQEDKHASVPMSPSVLTNF